MRRCARRKMRVCSVLPSRKPSRHPSTDKVFIQGCLLRRMIIKVIKEGRRKKIVVKLNCIIYTPERGFERGACVIPLEYPLSISSINRERGFVRRLEEYVMVVQRRRRLWPGCQE